MAGIDFIRDLAVVMLVAGVVGWICQRIGLSLVVGYLVAGAIIGPFTPPFQLVADGARVQMLSQLGLVFLIFSIGLNLGLQRLRRLGFAVVLATVVGAILVYHGVRVFGIAMGWSATQSLFVAGMLMVSSSAILAKVLQELNASHERSGQLALGVTVLEDTVAVVMLTLLSTLIQFGAEQSPPLAKTVAALTAFIGFLLFVLLLFVPRLLLKLTKTGTAEVRTIAVIGILLTLAWLAARAGYSLALGAFLIGVIVGSTPQKPEIERVFEGMRDMFGAVFFVAMGMLVDFSLLKEVWHLALILTVFTIVWRTISTSTGLLLAGTPTQDSLRAGMALTPLGEFSFIIAQMGVVAGAIPQNFYPMAVGVSLLTTLIAPSIIRRSTPISGWIEQHLPLVLREWIVYYHSWLYRAGQKQKRNIWWKLTRPRLIQIAVQILVVSAALLFSEPVHGWLAEKVGKPKWFEFIFWAGLALLLLAPLIAIWRNLEAVIMISAESITPNRGREPIRPVIETILKGVAALVLIVWLLALLPFGTTLVWLLLAMAVILPVIAAIFWRRLVYFHSRLEIELRGQLQAALGEDSQCTIRSLLEKQQRAWNLKAEEFVLPEFSAAAGKLVGEMALRKRFGCSIVSIERGGFVITNPGAEGVLYPNDKLLLLGSAEQIDKAIEEISAVRVDGAQQEIEEFGFHTVTVPDGCPHAGQRLLDLGLIKRFGVQIAGIRRGAERILTPAGKDQLLEGDELLVLGTAHQIRDFDEWLASSG